MEDDKSPLVREEQRSTVHNIPSHFLHTPVGHDSQSVRLPQTIAHRGYKGKYPENTLLAVDQAIRAGSHAIEIDLHVSRDGVVVLSHDGSLERCYGINKKIIDCDWAYLKTLRTLMAPHEPMSRLADILEYLTHPEREHIWALLDIKLDNDPAVIIPCIAETIKSVPIHAVDWHRRLLLGCWSARCLPPRARYLPRYAITLICIDPSYARQFLQVPRISFNFNQKVLMGPLGHGFLEEARAASRRVYVWTVNAPNLMRWSIRHQVDGVITDEPAQFREICAQWESEQKEGSPLRPDPNADRLSFSQRVELLCIALYLLLFGWFYKLKYFPTVERVHFEERKME